VKKGAAARLPAQKAAEKAAGELKQRYEDVYLRLEAGVDDEKAVFGDVTFSFVEAAAVQEPHETLKTALRLKAVFEGSNGSAQAATVVLARGTIVTAKGKTDLLVKNPKGEPFSRVFDPQSPKMFEYGVFLTPRYPPGTRAVLVFEAECGGRKQLLRSPLLTVAKKE
jgi:hypothetical protein